MGLTREQMRIVVILIAGATLAVLNQTLLSPAYPSIMADLAVDASTVQWLTSGYSLMEAIIIRFRPTWSGDSPLVSCSFSACRCSP